MKLRLIFLTGLAVGVLSSARADYCVTITSEAAAQHLGGSQQCGFPTEQAAQDYAASLGIDSSFYKISGSPDTSSSTIPSASSAPRWTPQQQMALSAAQAAMPALQQAVHNFMNGSPEEQAQQQRQLAATQLNNSGVYLEKQKDFAGALNEFQQAFSLNPSDKTIAENLVNAKNIVAKLQHNDRGLYLYNHQDYAGALDEFQQALALNPSDKTIAQNVVNAKLMLANTATATQESSMLGQLLGSQPPQTSTTGPNTDPNVVSFQGLKNIDLNYRTTSADQLQFTKGYSGSAPVNFSGLHPQKSANTSPSINDQQKIYQQELNNTLDANPSPPPAQDQQKLKDQLNNVLDANFDGQTHN